MLERKVTTTNYLVKLVDKGSSWKNETHDLLLAFDENGEPNIIKVRYMRNMMFTKLYDNTSKTPKS